MKWCNFFNKISLILQALGCAVLYFVIEAICRHSFTEAWTYMTTRPLVFAYNAAFIFTTMLIVYLFRKRIFWRIFVGSLWLFLGIVNGVLLLNRVTPFTGPDVKNLTDGLSIAKKYLTRTQMTIGAVLLGIAVLILLITCVLFKYTTFVQKNAIQQCFSILNDSREQIGQMITNEMKNEQEHLESASYLLKDWLKQPDANHDQIIEILKASSANQSYAHWEVCLPDETVIKSTGEVTELGPLYSFEDRVSKNFTVSERRTTLVDQETQIIMLSNSIFDENGTCIGILSSVIDLEAFADNFLSVSYNLKPDIMLFERGTGDVLLDSWNDGTLGSVEDAEEGRYIKAAKGFDWNEVRKSYKAGNEGNAAFHSKVKNEVVYMSYAPVDYSDWELLVFAPGFGMHGISKSESICSV